MKMGSFIAGVLFLVNMTSASAQQQTQNVHLTNIDYTLVSAELDQNRFSASNVLVSLMNVSENTLSVQLMNDICPKIPGKVSCLAMPYPLFIGDFMLGHAKVDACGVQTRQSDVVIENGERAQIIVRDYRSMICEIAYIADLEIILKTKKGGVKSVSTLLLNRRENWPDMPQIQPEFPIVPKIPAGIKSYFSTLVIEQSGEFFEGLVGLGAYLVLDTKAKSLSLEMNYNPCANLPCEAISAGLISRKLDVMSVKSNKCNEKVYHTDEVSVYDAYPAVVGAIHTYVQVELVDTRKSVCNQNGGMVYALVTVTKRQNLYQDVVVSVSTATFELNQIGFN